jgi:hypothetical protein
MDDRLLIEYQNLTGKGCMTEVTHFNRAIFHAASFSVLPGNTPSISQIQLIKSELSGCVTMRPAVWSAWSLSVKACGRGRLSSKTMACAHHSRIEKREKHHEI